MKRAPRGGITVAFAFSVLLCTFVEAVAEPPGWGLSFRSPRPHGHFRSHSFQQGKLHRVGHFRSDSFQGKVRPGKFFSRGKHPVVVPFIGGFYDYPPVVVTWPPARTIIINQPTPPSEPRKAAEPRLCPWIWTRETGKKQCLDEAFPSQGEGVVLRAPERAQ